MEASSCFEIYYSSLQPNTAPQLTSFQYKIASNLSTNAHAQSHKPTLTIVTSPACGIPAAPMLAAVAVIAVVTT